MACNSSTDNPARAAAGNRTTGLIQPTSVGTITRGDLATATARDRRSRAAIWRAAFSSDGATASTAEVVSRRVNSHPPTSRIDSVMTPTLQPRTMSRTTPGPSGRAGADDRDCSGGATSARAPGLTLRFATIQPVTPDMRGDSPGAESRGPRVSIDDGVRDGDCIATSIDAREAAAEGSLTNRANVATDATSIRTSVPTP